MKQLIVCAAVALLAVGCGGDGGASPTDPSQVNIEFTATDLVVGIGPQAAVGNTATVHYTLWLYNGGGAESKGQQLQTSVGGQPFAFVVGLGQVIRGFDQGTLGMRAGGKRRLYIPASLAYGSAGSQNGQIPPNAALVFEVELVSLVQ